MVSRGYRHRLRLVAEALVAVGRGVSYTRAAHRARVAAGHDPLAGDSAGQMVAEWVDAWAPAVVAAYAETEWPETMVLDCTDFWWTNARTHTRRREFAILVAYGYTDARAGRIWGIRASTTAQAHDWVRFLMDLDLPAPPVSVVADDDLAIRAAVRLMWPATPGPSLPQPFLFACEHRLRQRAKAALEADNAHAAAVGGCAAWTRRSAAPRAGTSSTTPRASWALPLPGVPPTTLNCDSRPPCGTCSRRITRLREPMPVPAGCTTSTNNGRSRNASRTNLLLGLTRLHLNNLDDVNAYHPSCGRQLRRGTDGPRQSQRLNRDARDANGDQQPSLR